MIWCFLRHLLKYSRPLLSLKMVAEFMTRAVATLGTLGDLGKATSLDPVGVRSSLENLEQLEESGILGGKDTPQKHAMRGNWRVNPLADAGGT